MMSDTKKIPKQKRELLNQLKGDNLGILLETIEVINSTNHVKSIVDESMEATRLVMKSEASSLMLLDRDTGELYVSLPTGPAKEDIKGKSIPKYRGIAGWVVKNKKPYITNDAQSSEHFWGELADHFTTRNLICVPLIDRSNKVVGVIQALNRRKGEDFTPHDIPVFQALASHIAVAISRAQKIDRIEKRISEKDAMITEIHHRIKNNLQTVSALLEKELPEIHEEKAKEVMRSLYLRIRSMSRLHDLLCRKSLSDKVDMDVYLVQLTNRIDEMMNDLHSEIQLKVNAGEVQIPSDKALLCGLILNELLLNIYKHAFVDQQEKAEIVIDLERVGDEIVIRLADNGIGFSEMPDFNKKSSFGLWIVDVMLKKLKATMDLKSEGGAEFTIRFKAE